MSCHQRANPPPNSGESDTAVPSGPLLQGSFDPKTGYGSRC